MEAFAGAGTKCVTGEVEVSQTYVGAAVAMSQHLRKIVGSK